MHFLSRNIKKQFQKGRETYFTESRWPNQDDQMNMTEICENDQKINNIQP